MQWMIDAAQWLGIVAAVVIAIGILVVAVMSWLLRHPGPL